MNTKKLASIFLLTILLVLPVGNIIVSGNALTIYNGTEHDEDVGNYYYYSPSMEDWSFYNPYIVSYLKINDDYKEIDGWNAIYFDEIDYWYYLYYQTSDDTIYHYNQETGVWYRYNYENFIWDFYSFDEGDIWEYNASSQYWQKHDPQEIQQQTTNTIEFDEQYSQIEATDDFELLQQWYFSQFSYLDWYTYEDSYEYDWNSQQWTFSDAYYQQELDDKYFDELFDSVIDSIWQYYQDSGGEITTSEYTFLVYLNGTDLESNSGLGTMDIAEMWDVGSSQNVNILFKTGGTSNWNLPQINPYMNQYWYVGQSEIHLLEDVSSVYEESICTHESITNFIEYAHENYPAEKYVIIYWNHGGGAVSGYGHDDHTAKSLSLNEIMLGMHNAKESTGIDFELIGFDACLMATLETMSMLSNYGKYFVASEELEPGYGWNYTPIIRSIVEKPWISGRDLGRVIVDSFAEYYYDSSAANNITLSLVDLGKIDEVVKNLEEFVKGIITDRNNFGDIDRFAQIVQARSRSESYGGRYPSDMVDLYDLADKLEPFSKEKALLLKSSIDNAVYHNINSINNPNAKGISIYYPADNPDAFLYSWEIYKDLYFSKTYREFIGRYLSRLMSNREHRSTTAFISSIKENMSREIEVDFNIHDIPKLKNVELEFYILEEKDKLLGSQSVLVDVTESRAMSTLVDEWYKVKDNYVKASLDEEGHKIHVDIELNDLSAELIYNSSTFDFVKAVLVTSDQSTKYVEKELEVGDKIVFVYGDVKGSVVIYNHHDDIELTLQELKDVKIGYRFVSKDILSKSTYSTMAIFDLRKDREFSMNLFYVIPAIIIILALSFIALKVVTKEEKI
jgi:hypothetical protein